MHKLSFPEAYMTCELRDLQVKVRDFAQDFVAPRALKNDAATEDHFDWEIVEEGHKLGLLRLIIPKEHGGEGIGIVGTAIVLEELAAACAGTALIFGATLLGQSPILLSADPELQARYLPKFSGSRAVLAANAITEPEAGCDLLIPENAKYAEGVVQAKEDGDTYELSGVKKFITNANVADFACVYATVGDGPGATGLTCFVVDLDSEGVTRGVVANKMGYRACLGSELLLDRVIVPKENIVGGVGMGMHMNIQQMNTARATVAAISTGVARSAFDKATAWAGERVQGGRRLAEQQFSAVKIAEMAAKIQTSRLIYLDAALRVDSELPAPALEPALAKLFADRAAIDVADTAMSLMGARGYVKDFGLEKIVRDAFGARIYEGSPEVLALAITESLYAADTDDF